MHLKSQILVLLPSDLKKSAGVNSATTNLFQGCLPIVSPEEAIISLASGDIAIFASFHAASTPIVKLLKSHGVKIVICWHFSVAIGVDPDIGQDWQALLPLLASHTVDLFVSCKQHLPQLVENVHGVPSFRLINRAPAPPVPPSHTHAGIGVYSGSSDYWAKNLRTNLYAALLTGLPIDIIPYGDDLRAIVGTAEPARIITGSQHPLSHSEFYARLASREAVLYCTFTEASPLLPLEALSLDVLCLTGDNHDYFLEDPILRQYLVVSRVDDPYIIKDQLIQALSHRSEILQRYASWKKLYDAKQQRNFEAFLQHLAEL